MMSKLIRLVTGLAMAGLFFSPGLAQAQTRDHLTDPETELIRLYQELDKRMEIFIKAIDRRFVIITGTAEATPKNKKDKDEWGEAPTGTRVELLGDIAGILDEAITNIDDVSRRDEKNPLITRSLRKLTTASNNYVAKLNSMKDKTTNPEELAAMDHVFEQISQILEVGNKLPPPAKDEDKKKKKP